MYALRIDDFSARSLQYMFIKHVDRTAKVITDKWKGYRRIAKAYNITQIESNNGMNFVLELTVHKLKTQYSIT